MDGDVGVAEQLGAEAEQSLAVLARKMQLLETQLAVLCAREEAGRREELELEKSLRLLRDQEATHTREAAAVRQELAAKSLLFQEQTRCASERLATRALQMEMSRLEALALELQARERELERELGLEGRPLELVDEASVEALLLEVRNLDRRFKKLAADHAGVHARAWAAVHEARGHAAVRRQRAEEVEEHRRMLEEAIENMSLLLVDAELSANDDSAVGASESTTSSLGKATRPGNQNEESTQPALTHLALLKDEWYMQFAGLQDVLRRRVESNRALAMELGLDPDLQERDDVGEGAGKFA